MTKLKAFVLVLFIHSFFLFQAFQHKPILTPKVAHKIKVQTIVHTQPPPPKPKPAPKVVAKVAPKIVPKIIAKPSPTPAPVPKPKQTPPPAPAKPKVAPEIIPPAPIKKLNVESEPDPGMIAHLIAIMQDTLALPEVGEVKIELTITSEGKVKELKVLSSHSELNRAYLETHLPSLIFPPKEKKFFGKDEETFIFAFHSLI
ncbi:MAG: hypothetical protein KBC64_04170 [Simkaniaceae bacterium]|nr:hypothetical protein [Simkaniaceae bacterium]